MVSTSSMTEWFEGREVKPWRCPSDVDSRVFRLRVPSRGLRVNVRISRSTKNLRVEGEKKVWT
jgi:hypothetical protein